MTAFDEAYSRYLSSLAELDKTDDISEKNRLFKRLTEQLTELERRVGSRDQAAPRAETTEEDAELIYWI